MSTGTPDSEELDGRLSSVAESFRLCTPCVKGTRDAVVTVEASGIGFWSSAPSSACTRDISTGGLAPGALPPQSILSPPRTAQFHLREGVRRFLVWSTPHPQ